MALTRRQFVTRLGALATAMGMSQVDLAKVTQAFAHSANWPGLWTNKPKVVWVHGAECTGCSTSLLSLFEDARGTAIEGTSISTLAALDLAVGGDGDGGHVLTSQDANHPFGHRTLQNSAGAAVAGGYTIGAANFDAQANPATGAYIANIADVLIDFIDLQYHETVMGMGGDLAYEWLQDLRDDATTGASAPFVMVVEGAVQDFAGGGHWGTVGGTGDAPWCSIGMGADAGEHSFDEVVYDLAINPKCAAIVTIGQCAAFGGYPGCVSPASEFSESTEGQTGAEGVHDFLKYTKNNEAAASKVINVPGCPTNPWWFVLTVVAWLVDYVNGPGRIVEGVPSPTDGPLGILAAAGTIKATSVDNTRRLKAVYGTPIHGPKCPRYPAYGAGIFAKKPGDAGCLQNIGCKGMSTNSLCGYHGWNSAHPHNDAGWDNGIAAINQYTGIDGGTYNRGGFCITAGAPCMGCTEQGYPDAFVPFVVR